MSCSFKLEDNKIYQALKKRFGTNETELFAVWSKVVTNDKFDDKFAEFVKNKRKLTEPITFENVNMRTIVNDMIAYYKENVPDGNLTVLDNSSQIIKDYISAADRNFCQRTVANEMLSIFRDWRYNKSNPGKLSRQEYINRARLQFSKYVIDTVCSKLDISREEFQSKLNKNRFIDAATGYINLGEDKETAKVFAKYREIINIAKELLGKNINNQEINLLATFSEMIDSGKNVDGVKTSDIFFNEVFKNKKLEEIRRDDKDLFHEEEETNAQNNEDVQLGENIEEETNPLNDSFDVTFRVYETHDGQYSSFTTHIGGNIRSYLNSLRKLKGTGTVNGNPYYNTDNCIGIADTMSVNECAMMLYTQADYTNVDSMIKSIERIAEQVPGFAAFSTFAKDLRVNYDFAYEVYKTFGKMVISKRETYIDNNGNFKSRITNNSTNKVDALRFTYMNEIRTSSINVRNTFANEEFSKLNKLINSFNTNLKYGFKPVNKKTEVDFNVNTDEYKADKLEIVNELTKQLRRYLPSINSSVILNYIDNNEVKGEVNVSQNIKLLSDKLKELIKTANNSYINYISRVAEAADANRHNREIQEEIDNQIYHKPDDFVDVSSIWEKGYLDKSTEATVQQLANMLVNYSVVDTELNSRNAKGNQSSDVINSSMITNIMNILKSSLNTNDNENSPLKNYGAFKFRNKQYNLSNILVEKTENGKITNYGLFKLENGKYVPTSYATRLLKLDLFNGVSDYNNNKALLYADMSSGDYIATAMVNFNTGDVSQDDITMANYFMRIPSDAPKNFILTAPKYSINNFWNLENEREVNSRIKQLIDTIPHGDLLDYVSDSSQKSNTNQAVSILTKGKTDSIDITSPKALVTEKNSLIAHLTLQSGNTVFVVKGTLNETRDKIKNVELVGIDDKGTNNVSYTQELYSALNNYYKNELIKGRIRLSDGSKVVRKINRNHPIFRQFVAVFQQEMQNAAIAIDKLFEHKNGRIVIDEDFSPRWSTHFSEYNNKDRATYANYHRKNNEYKDADGNKHKESGVVQNLWVEVTDENGDTYMEKTPYKRLSGNVFSSDRFTLFDENTETERNFLSEVLSEEKAEVEDGKIHILYGGANTHLHIDAQGNVEFTEAQQKLIEDKIEEFIQEYIPNVSNRLVGFENLLENIPHNESDIAEFALNYRLTYINCNDLFEGDTKFYKDSQTFLKRSKETQGSGVPYGVVDFSKSMYGQVHVEVEHSYLNSKDIQTKLQSLGLNVKQYTTFRAATITNVVRTSIESQTVLVDQLTEIFRNDGLTKTDAVKKAKAMMANTKGTTVDDAQSYITFEEWIRRVAARGQLTKYMPLIEAIMDESKPLNADIIGEFIQVQKNFYYDMYYDENTGTMAPRQIKNAEFVIVPRLVKGTELEQVYDLMKHYGIDQLNTEETSKAGKANVLTIWDKDGNITPEWTKDFNKNIQNAVETFDYNYLYTQQETPQHMNAENKAGIQIMKKILDNITENDGELWNVKQRFFEAYGENIYESFTNIMNDLQVELDENGNIQIDEKGNIKGLDYKLLLQKFEDEMMRLGVDSNMMDYITLEEAPAEAEFGSLGIGLKTKMRPYLNSNKRKIESISQAIFNNYITRQKLPGFHAAQITNVGWKASGKIEYVITKEGKEKGLKERISNAEYKALSNEDKKYYNKRKGSIVSNSNLRYHPNGEPYIEVMVPASNFGLDKNSSKYDNIREQGKKDGLTEIEIEALIDQAMLAELKAKGLDTFIGYRIPTEGKQSVCIMKVTAFTSDAYGSTIVVPDDWVTQTGSDFDIDSVYGIQYSTYTDKNGDIHKVEFSRDVKQNYLRYVLRNLSKEEKQELLNKAKLSKEDRESLSEELNEKDLIDIEAKLDNKHKENLHFYAKQYAKEKGLNSFETYNNTNISSQNSRNARNNEILDCMIEILSSPKALEENLSKSQFTNIIDARNKIASPVDKARRNARSPYDFLNQAEYQDDAMSGAKLKAFSVTRDTFCSICNTVRPVLSKPITVIYHGDDKMFKHLQKTFDIKVNNRYIGLVKKLDGNRIAVSHEMFGYSNTNKNVEDMILTSYSSQTTAHILDAIKEGPIKNVNDFTFAVYKMFPDIGSNYETAISFMMQPGVSSIVEAYNRNKSIYAKDYENPIDSAIRSIGKRLGIAKNNTSIKEIDEKVKAILVKSKFSNTNVLDSELLINRINNNTEIFTSPVEELLFDYLVVKQYQNLSNIANKIGALTRVCNPDKFGAKQTIFATNKIFDDIVEILNDDNPVFATKDKKSFLERIYPGIDLIRTEGFEAYMNYNGEKSEYPSLDKFLKYATCTSIKINRTIFATQKLGFRRAVEQIQNVMSGSNPRISEETYNKFEQYILSNLYNQVDVLSRHVTYEYGRGIVQTNSDITSEKNRIFGYGYTPELKVEHNDGEVKPFEPININKPTVEEIDAFSRFTPAQKVYWIQQHFRDGLVTKYLKTNLINTKEYRKAVAGMQTIEFVEDGVDIEQVYEDFRKTFANSNPLLVLTAMDIIKYGFIAEGYQLKRRAANKVIDNDALTNELGLFGTGIMNSLDRVISNFADNPNLSDIWNEDGINTLAEQFVRSHSTMPEISRTYINKKDQDKYIRRTSKGVITIAKNESNEGFLVSHNFGFIEHLDSEDLYVSNKFININFGKNNKGLYKIIDDVNSDHLYLIPLNTLQESETGVWSANSDNNKYMSSDYYETLIREYIDTYPNYDVKQFTELSEAKYKANKEQYSKPTFNVKQNIKETVDFDINDTSVNDIEILRTRIVNHFDGTTGSELYIESRFLQDHIFNSGIEHGLTKIIDGKAYRIFKINTDFKAGGINLYQYTSEKGLYSEVMPMHKEYEKLIQTARNRGIAAGRPGKSHLNNVFAVIPFVSSSNTERKSNITEKITRMDKSIRRKAVNENTEEAVNYVKQVNKRNVESNSKSIESHFNDVIISTSEYVNASVEKILNGEYGLNMFFKNPNTGEYLPITHPLVIETIKHDAKLRRNYLKTILEAQHIINTFSSFSDIKYSEQEKQSKHYIDKINEAINKLKQSPLLKEAEELYVTGYLASISSNPNIQKNIISLLDGFHNTSFLTSYLNDLQETSNPIIQIITNDVMSDIRAKEFQGEQTRREFAKFMKDIKKEAAKHGMSINWDNIVDETGKFINSYNDKFVEDLEAYRNTRDEAYSRYKNANNDFDKAQAFNDYLKARLEYNKFKLKYTNQAADDEYYRKLIANEESMFNKDSNKFSDIYVEYCMLNDRLSDILNRESLDEELEKQKDTILLALRNLRSNSYQTPMGDWVLKKDLEPHEYSKDPVKNRIQSINSLTAANRLKNFIEERKAINDEYHDTKERFGFKEQLDRYLSIVEKYEAKSPTTGRQLRLESENAQVPEYVEAKNWIKRNANFIYDIYKKGESALTVDEAKSLLIDAYENGLTDVKSSNFTKTVKAALDYFKKTAGERHNKKSIYKTIANLVEAYDEDGIMDGRKFSDEQIDAIRDEQERRYGIGESTPYSEKNIIKNSTSDDTIYTSAFYDGMRVNGLSNPDYLAIVKRINSILFTAYDTSTGVLHTSHLTSEQIELVLKELSKLGYDRVEQTFNTMDAVHKKMGVKRAQVGKAIKFIKDNVEFVLTEEDKRRFEIEKQNAEKLHNGKYYLAWLALNQEWNEEKQEFVPNHLFWGHAQPKSTLSEEAKSKFIDKQKTAAVKVLDRAFTSKTTKYYELEYEAKSKELGVTSPEFNDWYMRNHVYNPHKHIYEPLPCWAQSTPSSDMPGTWEANNSMSERTIKEEHRNKNYKSDLGVAANYKTTEGSPYNQSVNLNEYEQKVKEHVQKLLTSLVRNEKNKRRIDQGYLPAKAKQEEKGIKDVWLKELAKGVGYIENQTGYDRWNDNVEYGTDYVPTMPMLEQLVNKETHRPPYKEQFKTPEEYEKAKKEYEKNKEQYKKENAEIHKNLLDRNWEAVLDEFIGKAAHYNAIQDNKYQLYFGQKLLNDILVYQTRMSTIGNLKKDSQLSTDEETIYQKKADKHLQDQYTNWVRRVVFDQYKKPQGKKTRVMQILQSVTSTNYMTLNIKGGIANVLIGESNIFGEVFAREYLGAKDWAIGKRIWTQNVANFTANMYNETSTSKADAIIKAFNIVDYDEVTGRVSQVGFEEWSRRLRDAMFSPQTIGEHFMQNSVMFSMMNSHRMVNNPRYGEKGQPKYLCMNETEYVSEAMEEALRQVCTKEEYEKYKDFVEHIKDDPNKAKEYAWFRENAITNFAMQNLSRQQQKDFAKIRNKYKEEKAKEFKTFDTLYSQLKLGDDGKMDFVPNSKLAEMNELKEGQEVSDAYKLIGKFKGRVISVNKKIHGNYGKLDAAKIESEWWGGLVMQYHKHIVPGIMKRWRRQGYWNEERGTVEKGSYIALYDFLTAPIKQIAEKNRMSTEQTQTLQGLQNIFGMITDYFHYLKCYINVMPDYEKANMRRVLGDVAGLLVATMGTLLLRLGWDDDDDSVPYNLGLYEMDRLATEAFMWNPAGLYSEAKKLWSSPVAAQSIISDCLNIMGTTAGIILEGEDYDPYFHSGRYAGQHKLGVYVERRIPYWRNYVAIRDIADSNHYYKLGDNLLSWLPIKDWANSIKN